MTERISEQIAELEVVADQNLNRFVDMFVHGIKKLLAAFAGQTEFLQKSAAHRIYADSAVHPGAATILCTVGAEGMREYDVEIVEASRQSAPAQRSLVLRVTDQASPGVSTAAAGLSSQRIEPSWGLGRDCQGSMQMNLGMPGLLQIRV